MYRKSVSPPNDMDDVKKDTTATIKDTSALDKSFTVAFDNNTLNSGSTGQSNALNKRKSDADPEESESAKQFKLTQNAAMTG